MFHLSTHQHLNTSPSHHLNISTPHHLNTSPSQHLTISTSYFTTMVRTL
ncbi:MAG: hypothetical protein MR901_05315 [Prevotella sp.]|nr:hypothetical protein [Prevotella sp.]